MPAHVTATHAFHSNFASRTIDMPAGYRSKEFERTASRYSPVLYRTALRKLGNHEDAEEAVQDAVLSAFCHLCQFEGRSQMSTWLTQIVINAARMKLRRRPRHVVLSIDELNGQQGDAVWDQLPDGRRPRHVVLSIDELNGQQGDAVWDQLPDPGPSPEKLFEEMEVGELLHTRLKCLSSKLRVALHLFYVDGLTAKQAAQVLGISETALKYRLVRARTLLRLLLRLRPLGHGRTPSPAKSRAVNSS